MSNDPNIKTIIEKTFLYSDKQLHIMNQILSGLYVGKLACLKNEAEFEKNHIGAIATIGDFDIDLDESYLSEMVKIAIKKNDGYFKSNMKDDIPRINSFIHKNRLEGSKIFFIE